MSHVAYILRSYPRLSQTFILSEIRALERLGTRLSIYALTNPHEPIVQAEAAEVRASVRYLDAAASRPRAARVAEHILAALAAPRRYAAALWYVLRSRDLDEGYTAATRFECLLHAVYLARLMRSAGITHVHAHFAHDPALIALLVHMLTGLPFSFTAHARDLFQVPRRALVDRIRAASAVVTCCAANLEYLNEVTPAELRPKLRLIHHGVNLEGFQPARPPQLERDPPVIMSVGRLVEKKGFPDLLLACQHLKRRGLSFCCVIFGEGPMREELEELIDQLGLGGDVALAGERSQQELIPRFQSADIFALAPFVTEDGDRDGVPNVLAEAMACGLPVVSTAVAGIPELVHDGHTGLLVEPRDVDGLADRLDLLLADPPLRRRLGEAARRKVVEDFDLRTAARQLAALFEEPAGLAARLAPGARYHERAVPVDGQ